MSLDIFAKALAPVLGYEKSKVDQYIHKLLELAIEALLIQGEVKFAGIGLLKRKYHPAEPREKEPGQLYLYPPSQTVELSVDKQFDSGDFVYETAISQFQMSEENALRFSKGFAVSIEKSIAVRGKLDLGVLGTFEKQDEAIIFKASPQLEDLLKKPYDHLEPTKLNQSMVSEEKSEPTEQPELQQPTITESEPQTPQPDVEKPSETTQTQATPPPIETPPSEPVSSKEEDEPDLSWLYEDDSQKNKTLYYIIGGVALVIVLLGGGYLFLASGDSEKKTVAEKVEKSKVDSDTTSKIDQAKEVIEENIPDKPTPKPARSKPSPKKAPTKARVSSKPPEGAPWFVPPSLTKKLDLSKRGYAISVASFPERVKAENLASSYSQKGFAVTVWEVEIKGNMYFRVLIGSFNSRSKALKAKKDAGNALPKDAFIVKVN